MKFDDAWPWTFLWSNDALFSLEELWIIKIAACYLLMSCSNDKWILIKWLNGVDLQLVYPWTVFFLNSHSTRSQNVFCQECTVRWTPSTVGHSCFTGPAVFANYSLHAKCRNSAQWAQSQRNDFVLFLERIM